MSDAPDSTYLGDLVEIVSDNLRDELNRNTVDRDYQKWIEWLTDIRDRNLRDPPPTENLPLGEAAGKLVRLLRWLGENHD